MPQKITMNLHNSNYNNQYLASLRQKQSVLAQPPKNASLNSSMVERIHTARPGCGSCGRR